MADTHNIPQCLYPNAGPCSYRYSHEENGKSCKAKPGDPCPFIRRGTGVPQKRPEQVFSERIAGDHYRTMGIQPAEYAYYNELGFLEGNIIKYVTRWKKKNGIEDLRKARNYIDLLISFEEN